MSKSKKVTQPQKAIGVASVIGAIGVICQVAHEATPLIDKAVDVVKEKRNQNKNPEQTISMPNLCDKDFPISIEQAAMELESLGLKMTAISLQPKDAEIKYKNCFDSQVIRVDKKYKQKVKPGEYIRVVYITQEVIDESKRLFDELEEQKSERIAERKEKIKNGVDKLLPIHRKQHDDEN